MKSSMQLYFYVTRDTGSDRIKVWDSAIGIRKFTGCVQYGIASRSGFADDGADENFDMIMSVKHCRNTFGFAPEPEEAWLVDGNKQTIERVDQDMAFSD